MRKVFLSLLAAVTLAAPVFGGVKKYPIPVQPAGAAAPGTSAYNTVYLCDALSDLTAITGQTGDIGMVSGYGAGQIFTWDGLQWLQANTISQAQFAFSVEGLGGAPATGAYDPAQAIFGAVTANSGAVITAPSSAYVTPAGTHPGQTRLRVITNSASFASLATSNTAILLGNGDIYYESLCYIAQASTGAQRFEFAAGFHDGTTITPVDGVYFRYKDDVNGGEFEGVCVSNSSASTPLDTNVAMSINTWYKFGITVNAAGSLATFYINGSSVGTISSNIPTGTGRTCSAGVYMTSTVGTGARDAIVDYIKVQGSLAVAR